MKGSTASITRPLPLGAQLVCADNSGAKILEIIAVKGYHGRLRRLPRAGVADVIMCSVKKGKEKVRHTVVHAVVVVNPKTYEPVGTEVRSVIAKEVVERFTAIGKIASMVL